MRSIFLAVICILFLPLTSFSKDLMIEFDYDGGITRVLSYVVNLNGQDVQTVPGQNDGRTRRNCAISTSLEEKDNPTVIVKVVLADGRVEAVKPRRTEFFGGFEGFKVTGQKK
jgi:hypothetical protein